MADIKNFSLVGIGSSVQFGKGGARLIESDDSFAFKTADGSALVPVQVGTPASASDAATKAYVDSAVQGLDIKQSVRAASTENIVLTGLPTVDGVVLVAGDRVLVKDQTDAKENGIYVASVDAWLRAPDANANGKITAGMFAFVEEGTLLQDTGWVLSTDGNISIGVSEIGFTQFSAAGVITAGLGIEKTGNAVAVKANGDSITVDADGIKVSDALTGAIADATADIEAIQLSIADLDKTKIVSVDTHTSVDAAGDEVVISAQAGADEATSVVAKFKAGSGSNANFSFDTATLDTVAIRAEGTSDNVNVQISPKGEAGVVFIGQSASDSVLQAEDAMDLHLVGGDFPAIDGEEGSGGEGGNVILRGGQGALGNGSVILQSPNGTTMMSFTGDESATSALNHVSGTTTFSLVADGPEDDISLVLTPKGLGKVSVSNAIISDVATPVADTDAANKAYVDDAVSAVGDIAADKVGSMRSVSLNVTTVGANFAQTVKGRILRVLVNITEAYDLGELTVGTSGNEAGFVAAAYVDETTVGTYEVSVGADVVDATIVATFTDAPTTGAATITVEYVQS